MTDWTVIAGVGVGLLLILGWISLEEPRRRWKRAVRRRRCSHPDPCVDGVYRSSKRGWARKVYYCPDCKHLWAQRIAVPDAEWERLDVPGPQRAGAAEGDEG
jgi:hypothetical protein